jgi:methionine-rich copper-binding protein CopC
VTNRRLSAVRTGLVALAVLTIVVVTPGVAAAHAKLRSSYPAAGSTVAASPGRVSLRFNEPVALVPGAVTVATDLGVPVALDAPTLAGGTTVRARLQESLGAGRYILGWRIRSDDGHIESSTFFFSVGGAGPATPSGPAQHAAAPATPRAPGEPIWPVIVAAAVAVTAGLGAGLVVRRGLRALERGAGSYPAEAGRTPRGLSRRRHRASRLEP